MQNIKSNQRIIAKFAIGATVLAIGLIAANSGIYTVDAGERGVVLSYGEISSIADPGLHFKIPAVHKIVRIPTRTTTGTLNKVLAYSSDQQLAEVSLSITFSVSEEGVGELYKQFGSVDNAYKSAVVPRIYQEMKTVFGQFTAIRAVQRRQELNNEVQDAVVESLKQFNYLNIKSVQIENIDFSDAYEQTIEDRMKAEVEVERYRQNLEREKVEAQIVQTRAQAEADAKVKAAEGEAKAIALRAQAEADAIRQKGEALNANPNAIYLLQLEKWNGALPQTMLPNSSLPMLQLQQ